MHDHPGAGDGGPPPAGRCPFPRGAVVWTASVGGRMVLHSDVIGDDLVPCPEVPTRRYGADGMVLCDLHATQVELALPVAEAARVIPLAST